MARVGVQVVGDAASAKAAFEETTAAAVKMGDDLVAVDSKIVQSRARQIAALRENIAAYKELGAAAAAGSDEQVAALGLAGAKQTQLAKLTRDATAANREQTAAIRETTVAAREQGGVLSKLDGLTKALIAGFALKTAFDFGKSAVSGAAEIQKSQETIQQEFGSSSRTVLEFGKSAAAAFGISEKDADSAAVRFGILFNNLHFGTQRAAEMTQGWESLVGAIAKIRDVDPTSLLNSVALAAAGNARGMKQLGIAINPVVENQQALNDGYGTTFAKLTSAQRATVLYQLATANLSRDLSLAKQHSGDLANEQRQLSAEWSNAKDQLGNDLAPALQQVVHGVDDLVHAFSALPGPVKNGIATVTVVFAAGAPLLIGLGLVLKAVTNIRTAFSTIGPAAQTAAAEADASMATVGATAETTAAEVGTVTAAEGAAGGVGALRGLGTVGLLATAGYFGGKYAAAGLRSGIDALGGHENNTTPAQLAAELRNLPATAANKQQLAGILQKAGSLMSPEDKALIQAFLSEPTGSTTASRAAGAAGSRGASSFLKAFANIGNQITAGATVDTSVFGAFGKIASDLKSKITDDETKAKTKIQKDYAGNVATRVEQLKASGNSDALIAFYRKEASDPSLTAIERARYQVAAETEQRKVTNAAATAQRKAAAAAAKAQREYASGIATRSDQLKAGTETARATSANASGLTAQQRSRFDALIGFYQSESHDSKLTAAERSKYQMDAVSAAKQEAALGQKDALAYEKVKTDAAKARYDLVRRVKSDIDQKEAALRGEITAFTAAGNNKALSPTDRATFRTDAANARGQLAQLRNTFVLPNNLAFAQAKASSTDFGRTSMADIAVAERIKRYDERLLQSHALSLQGQIAVYENIAQQNQVLGATVVTGAARAVSSAALASQLGLHGAAKIRAEQLLSQVMAHAGHVPTGISLQGHFASIPAIHTHVILNGREIASAVTSHQSKQRSRTAVQNRGPNAGRVLA